MAGCITPQLLQPLVTTAPVTVEFVPDRVILVIVLVVILGGVELCGLYNLGYNGTFERFALFQLRLRLQREPVLFPIMIKDGAPILMPRITELPVPGGRVDVVPENIQELFVADPRRVIDNLDLLGVPGPPG